MCKNNSRSSSKFKGCGSPASSGFLTRAINDHKEYTTSRLVIAEIQI